MNAVTRRYHPLSRFLHWFMALLILGLIAVGVYMHELPDDAPNRLHFYTFHKTFGVIVFVLVWLRLGWSHVAKPPALPAVLQGWEIALAKITKLGLYVLMIATPFAGYAMSNFADKPVALFGKLQLPTLFAPSKAMAETAGEVHEVFAFTLLALVVLHVAGALKHRLFDRADADVLGRML